MIGRTTLNVSLTPELTEFVAATVASGRYQSASEVVREGLRLVEERELLRQAGLEEARKKIAAGLESLDRGEGIPGEQVFAEIEARLSRLEKNKGGQGAQGCDGAAGTNAWDRAPAGGSHR